MHNAKTNSWAFVLIIGTGYIVVQKTVHKKSKHEERTHIVVVAAVVAIKRALWIRNPVCIHRKRG